MFLETIKFIQFALRAVGIVMLRALSYRWHTPFVVMFLIFLLVGCATPHASRQMNEMSTDQLIRELAKPL